VAVSLNANSDAWTSNRLSVIGDGGAVADEPDSG
jgi:hypothetical protein